MSNGKPTLLRSSLLVGPTRMGSFWEGWAPGYSFTMTGPVPSASEIVAEFKKPDGSDWLSVNTSVDECGPDDLVRVRQSVTDESLSTKDTGDVTFRFRLVSELEGVDETLFEGRMRVEETTPGSKDFLARHDGLLPLGTLSLDVDDDADAPRLKASVHMSGQVETYELGAYLFRDGKKVFSSEQDQVEIGSGASYLPSSGASGGRAVSEVVVELSLCKGYRNCEYGDMEGWLELDKNPGKYEIKITRQKKLDRVLEFTVEKDGRIAAAGPIERTANGGYRMVVPVKITGKLDADWDPDFARTDAFYGNPDPVDEGLSMDVFYASRKAPEAPEGPGTGLDSESQERLDTGIGKSENMYGWYWDDLEKGGHDYSFLQQCEMAVMRADEALQILDGFDEDLSVTFRDEPTTLSAVKETISTIRSRAQDHMRASQEKESDAKTPFREALRNDKLRLFEESPVPDYRYYTSGKKQIETPEELAEATSWYFEGVENQGYVTEKWTVRGWRFDEDHTIVEEIDESGFGSNAPRKAFP